MNAPTTRDTVLIVGHGPLADAYVRGLTYYGIGHSQTPHGGDAAQVIADSPGRCVVSVVNSPADLEVTAVALAAGKHVYETEHSQRTRDQLAELDTHAGAHGVLLGTGPDAFLGQTVQTGRAVLAGGTIGPPLGADALLPPDGTGTDPDGAALPAFLSGVVSLFGPIVSVSRVDPTNRSAGRSIALLSTGDGIQVRLAVTPAESDTVGVWIAGTTGRLRLQHPGHYDRPVCLRRGEGTGWQTVEPTIPPTTDRAGALFRGPGVRDLLAAVDGAPHRASAARRVHLLDAVAAVLAVLDGANAITLPAPLDLVTA